MNKCLNVSLGKKYVHIFVKKKMTQFKNTHFSIDFQAF